MWGVFEVFGLFLWLESFILPCINCVSSSLFLLRFLMCGIRLACVVASRFLPGFGGGELFLCWRFPADVFGGEPSRADVACWGGWGPHTPCARQIGPHPPQPTPPSRHGSLRCVWVRGQKCGLPFAPWLHRFACVFASLSFFRVTSHSGAGAHGIARARGEPFRQSLLAVCGGRLTP